MLTLRNLILISLCLFARMIGAQDLSPTVVNSTGGVFSNNSHSLEWSLGELAVSTITSPGNLLTQGFLQPNIGIGSDTDDLLKENGFWAFPNPVSDWLNLQTDIPNIETVQVYDVSGKLVMQSRFQPILDVSTLNQGVFVISIFNKQNKLLLSFKINKI